MQSYLSAIQATSFQIPGRETSYIKRIRKSEILGWAHLYTIGWVQQGSSLNCIKVHVPTNPCPCGYYPDMKRCTCTLGEVKRYNEKISGPLLDRMDINIELSRMSYEDVTGEKKGGGDSEKMRDMVSAACERQRKRFGEEKIYSNSGIPVNKIDQYCRMERGARTLIKAAFNKMNLSARGYHRILKVSRTIADIEGSELIKEEHIEEALLLRNMERT